MEIYASLIKDKYENKMIVLYEHGLFTSPIAILSREKAQELVKSINEELSS